jgi:hypothetical protein
LQLLLLLKLLLEVSRFRIIKERIESEKRCRLLGNILLFKNSTRFFIYLFTIFAKSLLFTSITCWNGSKTRSTSIGTGHTSLQKRALLDHFFSMLLRFDRHHQERVDVVIACQVCHTMQILRTRHIHAVVYSYCSHRCCQCCVRDKIWVAR